MAVIPLAMVKRLKKLIRYQVIRQLNSTAHSRSVPKFAPALLIAVRLPVPILYPIRKILMKRTGHMGVDFSPFIVIILLDVFRRILTRLLLF